MEEEKDCLNLSFGSIKTTTVKEALEIQLLRPSP